MHMCPGSNGEMMGVTPAMKAVVLRLVRRWLVFKPLALVGAVEISVVGATVLERK